MKYAVKKNVVGRCLRTFYILNIQVNKHFLKWVVITTSCHIDILRQEWNMKKFDTLIQNTFLIANSNLAHYICLQKTVSDVKCLTIIHETGSFKMFCLLIWNISAQICCRVLFLGSTASGCIRRRQESGFIVEAQEDSCYNQLQHGKCLMPIFCSAFKLKLKTSVRGNVLHCGNLKLPKVLYMYMCIFSFRHSLDISSIGSSEHCWLYED